MDLLNPPVSRGRYVYDLETDNLLADVTRIHCAVLYDLDTEELIGFRPNELGKFMQRYTSANLLIGHNIIGYDAPVIQKLWGLKPSPSCEIIDTLPLARLIYSDIKQEDFPAAKAWKKYKEAKQRWDEEHFNEASAGREGWDRPYPAPAPKEFPGQLVGAHSLEAWGYRLGAEKKGDYSKEMKAKGLDPWASFNEDMFVYMLQDARVNVGLYRHLIAQEGYTSQAVALEMACQALCCRMERNGWPLDRPKAYELLGALTQRRMELAKELAVAFPPWRVRLEDFVPKRNNKTQGYVAGVPVERWEERDFNPSSRDHIADRLTDKYGWKPTEFTDGGSPKVDDEVLKALPYPEAKLLAEYFLIQKRIGQLAEGSQAWLNQVTKRGKIHARYNSNGAVTGRATHSNPNIAQVPSVGSPYGRDCRALFTVPRGWVQLGADQSGLELRCLGSFMAAFDGGAYIETVINGDVHWQNAIALYDLPADTVRDDSIPAHKTMRNVSKTFIYAYLYGAGPEKLGSITGVTKKELAEWKSSAEHRKNLKAIQQRYARRRQPVPNGTRLCQIYKGQQLSDRFLKAFPALKKLLKAVKSAAEKGWLKGLDGRKLPIRSEHAALNTLLQAAGSCICKSWITKAERMLAEAGYRGSEGIGGEWDTEADFVFLGWIHDEVAVAVRDPDKAGAIAAIIQEAGRSAGDCFPTWRCPTDVETKVGDSWATTH